MMYMSPNEYPEEHFKSREKKSKKIAFISLFVLLGIGLVLTLGYTKGWSMSADVNSTPFGVVEDTNIGPLPENFPPDLPSYPNMSVSKINADATGNLIGYNANIHASSAEIISWYDTNLKKLKWTITKKDAASLSATKASEICHLYILTDKNGSQMISLFKETK